MENLNRYIDHTLLKPEATPDDIKRLCQEAAQYNFYSVCVNPPYVKLAADTLKELNANSVKVAAVCGFPLGASTTSAKVYEASEACDNGAAEIDMVINVGLLKAGCDDKVKEDISQVSEAVHSKGGILKVIIETCLLNDTEKTVACLLAVDAGADFVKTSTGFSTGGATTDDVSMIKELVKDKAKVKASGGIRDRETALAMINAGADRIGASASIKIVSE